ncbi:hypothetical protein MmiAt1_10670 [Methanimicrococcus sp. At1]|uniref:Uncharacterized protein n=1 Tax=Methanimicrococcus hacksteinii TaxID=3028293 RepID=A0ABU3VPZ3_9EURY|nr:hypothetical protein [Methanimicrococcus sp. At1]
MVGRGTRRCLCFSDPFIFLCFFFLLLFIFLFFRLLFLLFVLFLFCLISMILFRFVVFSYSSCYDLFFISDFHLIFTRYFIRFSSLIYPVFIRFSFYSRSILIRFSSLKRLYTMNPLGFKHLIEACYLLSGCANLFIHMVRAT